MALAFALIKQMLKLENRSKEVCDFGRDLWIASRAATCAKNAKKPLYPKPHRNPLLEGLRPTLEAARVAESQAGVRPDMSGRPARSDILMLLNKFMANHKTL